MKNPHCIRNWSPIRFASRFSLACATSLGAALTPAFAGAGVEAPTLGRPVAVHATAAQAAPLSLDECLQMAFQRQPALAVQRASLEAAQDNQRAVETLLIPTFIARELPVRRRQAGLGVVAASAGLIQAEYDMTYAVTRTYFTVVYARQQEQVARSVVDRLKAVHEAASQSLKGGARDVTATDVDRAAVYLDLARAKLIQATEGVQRGLGALREAIGLESGACLDVQAGPLPVPHVHLRCDEVVAWALSRRGELVLANTLVEVTCLEIEAQGTNHRPRMQTFAAGADIHSRQVAQEYHNSEYRPGAQPPEMPIELAGCRDERMKHARSLYERAGAAAEKARNLVALDAEDAFHRWQSASARVARGQTAATAGERLAEGLRSDYISRLKVKTEDVINAQVLAAQAQSQQNEALYNEILALADIERATAGGFSAASAWQSKPKPAPKRAAPKLFGGGTR